MTLRELVAKTRASHRMLSSDGLLNDRAVAGEIRAAAFMLIRRETNLRRLWATDTLFTTLPCLSLSAFPAEECGLWGDVTLVARSEPLPRIAEGNYQYLIQGVWSINALSGKGTRFRETTLDRYRNTLRLPRPPRETFFFLHNSRLYLTDPHLEAVMVKALFEEDVPPSLLYPSSCGLTPPPELLCQNPLDREFPLPGYLEKQVLELVSQKLLSSYFRTKSDLTSDGVDGQAPNAPEGK